MSYMDSGPGPQKSSRVRSKKVKMPKMIILGIVIVVAVCFLGGFYFFKDRNNKQQLQAMVDIVETDTIYQNIRINDIDVSLLTKEEAKDKLSKLLIDSQKEKHIILAADGLDLSIKEIAYSDLNAVYDIEAAIDLAYNYAREGELSERAKLIENLEAEPFEVEAQYTFDTKKVAEVLKTIEAEVYIEPQNASITRSNGRFNTTKEVPGRKMLYDEAYEEILDLITYNEEGTVHIYTQSIDPQYLAADLERATTLIGTFNSSFTGGTAGRNENIVNASNKINEYVLYPDEIFSTNATFGAMTYDNGYRLAPSIIGGQLKDDMGGGVCQVSSTLYMAVLHAELNIVERQNHSQKVGYMDYAFDATLAGDYIDFKFKNDTEYPIFIESIAQNSKLTVNIYGYEVHSPSRRLEFFSKHVETVPAPEETIKEDPSLALGERVVDLDAKSGQKYDLYKTIHEDGKQAETVLINHSYYRPRAAVVRVGTGEAPEMTVPEIESAAVEQTPPPVEQTPQPVEQTPEPPAEIPQSGNEDDGSNEPDTSFADEDND